MTVELQPQRPTESPQETPPVTFTEEELNAIAKTIFSPEEGWVNTAVRFYTGRSQLSGGQKIALAPANAIEGLVHFGISLFDKQTYSDLATLAGSVTDPAERAALMSLLNKGWENCTTEEKSAFVLQIVCTVGFSVGALSKLKQVIPAAKLEVLMRGATTRQLANLANAIIASPLDDMAAATAPALIGIQQTPNQTGQ